MVVPAAVVHGPDDVSSGTTGAEPLDVDVDAPLHPWLPASWRLSRDICSSSCSRPALMCRIRATEAALRGALCSPLRRLSRRWDRLSSELRHPW